MTNHTNYPMTPEQYTQNIAAITSLLSGRTRGPDNIRVTNARIAAARRSIARMQTYHDSSSDSRIAPIIAARIAEMAAQLNAAVKTTPQTTK